MSSWLDLKWAERMSTKRRPGVPDPLPSFTGWLTERYQVPWRCLPEIPGCQFDAISLAIQAEKQSYKAKAVAR